MEDTENQNKKHYKWLDPFKFKPGESGNPGGRPKGAKSLKTYAKEYLESLSEEEKLEYMKQVDPDLVWRMAEGNPKQDTKIEGEIKVIPILGGIANDLSSDQSSSQDTQP